MVKTYRVESVRVLYFAWPQAVREEDGDGETPIHFLLYFRTIRDVGENDDDASATNRHEAATFLIQQRPQALRHPSRRRMHPLHEAAANETLPPDLFQLIVERSPPAHLRMPGGRGLLPIHWAAMQRRNDAEAVRALLAADPESIHEKDCDGKIPLHHAASRCNVLLVQLLIERGPRALLLEGDNVGSGAAPLCRRTFSLAREGMGKRRGAWRGR